MCDVKTGDIVRILAKVKGEFKYHLCVREEDVDHAACFLFLNSNQNFPGVYAVDCNRVPFLKPSSTGVTAFSFSMIPRYNRRQLKLYRAEVLGRIEKDLAAELLSYARTVTTLGRSDKLLVCSGLESLQTL